jgi:hypothetical protein
MHNIYETSKIYAGHQCPTFNLRNVFKRRNAIITNLQDYYELTLTADDFPRFSSVICEQFKDITPTVIVDSLRYLIGQRLSKDLIVDVAWRLAGNLPTLQQNMPIHPWLSQRFVEWVPIVVQELKDTATGKVSIIFKVLAGTPCPYIINFNWSEKAIRFFSRKIGFTADRGKRPLGHYTNITGMVFAGCLLPSLSATQPAFPFDGVHCMSSMLTNNKKLIDSRCRAKVSCPMNYNWPCYNCFVGRDKCGRAIRLTTQQNENTNDNS